MSQCDYGATVTTDGPPNCNRWVCPDHGATEGQWWDLQGWDGVDIRCMEHRSLSFAKRDLVRGRYLPPSPAHGGVIDDTTAVVTRLTAAALRALYGTTRPRSPDAWVTCEVAVRETFGLESDSMP